MTGSGKGLLMADIASDVISRGKKCLVVMRRRELIFQTQKNFKNYLGVECGIVMGSEKSNFDCPIQITSIDTVSRRFPEFLKEFSLVIVDEAHDTTSASYEKFFEFLGDKIFCGFTATPFSISGKTLSFWEDYVLPISAADLRDEGHLCPIDCYAPAMQIETKGIKKVAGDFNEKQLFDAASEKAIVGDVVENYKKYGLNRPAILFAVNIEHSQMMADVFNKAGISATHLDNSHCQDERQSNIDKLKKGEIKILCNVNLFSTGVDIPELAICIMVRPTMSEVLFVQQVGRVLRNPPGKGSAVLIDHAGNCYRHGLPYDDREAAIGSEAVKKEKITTSKSCDNCFAVVPIATRICPLCKHSFEVASERDGKKREINSVDGQLKKIESLEFFRIKKELDRLNDLSKYVGWKPNRKYFLLHERFGDKIFKYEKELGINTWAKQTIMEGTKRS